MIDYYTIRCLQTNKYVKREEFDFSLTYNIEEAYNWPTYDQVLENMSEIRKDIELEYFSIVKYYR